MSNLTEIIDFEGKPKRVWTESASTLLLNTLKKKHGRAIFIAVKGILECGLCEAGFEKKHPLNSEDCMWVLESNGWKASVQLILNEHGNDDTINFYINGTLCKIRYDIMVDLWDTLREDYYDYKDHKSKKEDTSTSAKSSPSTP